MSIKQWFFDMSTILIAVLLAEVIVLMLQQERRIPNPSAPLSDGVESNV